MLLQSGKPGRNEDYFSSARFLIVCGNGFFVGWIIFPQNVRATAGYNSCPIVGTSLSRNFSSDTAEMCNFVCFFPQPLIRLIRSLNSQREFNSVINLAIKNNILNFVKEEMSQCIRICIEP